MPGLIETSIDTENPTGSIVGYDPERITVNAEEDTVAGQLRSLISENSPLLQGAQTRGLQSANDRGLLNSTMGIQAGEEALYQSALPIASQDASTYYNARSANAAAGNRGMEFTAGATNLTANQVLEGNQNIEAIETTGTQQRETLAQSGEQDIALEEARAGNEIELQTLKGTQATGLATIEADYKTLMQTNASAATLFAQTQSDISDIMNDPDTSVEQKQAGVDHALEVLKLGLDVIGAIGGVDLTGLLDFSIIEDLTISGDEEPETPFDVGGGGGYNTSSDGDGQGGAGPGSSESDTGPGE